MNLDAFKQEPWKVTYDAYENSAFNIRPAPEFATAEVIVASLYRRVGFAEHSEKQVPSAGRELDRLTQRVRIPKTISPRVSGDMWRTVLHGVLESPKQPNQSSRRFLQLTPLVPDAALYSGSARLAGNSWNPGYLVQRLLEYGTSAHVEATKTWNSIYDALSVDSNDDIWAQWLQDEFERWNVTGKTWSKSELKHEIRIPDQEKDELRCPAKQFVPDLLAILAAKHAMTRRQWVSLVETILRLGSVTHILWLCDVSDRIWRSIRNIMAGHSVPAPTRILPEIINHNSTYLIYGNPGVPLIRDYTSRYLAARLGINLTLWHLHQQGLPTSELNSAIDVHRLFERVATNRARFEADGFIEQFQQIQDAHSRTVACKKGIGSNMVEFGRHALGRRQTLNDTQRGYDQGYFLRKKGEHRSAPWMVSLGPAAVLALVHCCLQEAAGPRSIQRFRNHLRAYGIEVHLDDIAKSDLGQQLRMLGLVLDSPDAESGMLLVPPFKFTG